MSAAAFILGGLAALTAAGGTALVLRQRRRRRVKALAHLLEAAVAGGDLPMLADSENELSVLEDEIIKTVGELRIAKEQAQAARLQQADNLADIAHQLKTPITSMGLLVELLADEASPRQQDYLARLEGQLDRLERLTAALLTLSRLDAGAIVFAPREQSFADLAAQALSPVAQQIAARGQMLTITGGEELIRCDTHWTAEALLNLLKNASEHAPQGGQLSLTYSVTPLYAQIVVEDDGPGFEAHDLPHLFRRFYRGSHAQPQSIGIGLAMTQAIITGQGGLIRAENRRQGGARFVLRLYPECGLSINNRQNESRQNAVSD